MRKGSPGGRVATVGVPRPRADVSRGSGRSPSGMARGTGVRHPAVDGREGVVWTRTLDLGNPAQSDPRRWRGPDVQSRRRVTLVEGAWKGLGCRVWWVTGRDVWTSGLALAGVDRGWEIVCGTGRWAGNLTGATGVRKTGPTEGVGLPLGLVGRLAPSHVHTGPGLGAPRRRLSGPTPPSSTGGNGTGRVGPSPTLSPWWYRGDDGRYSKVRDPVEPPFPRTPVVGLVVRTAPTQSRTVASRVVAEGVVSPHCRCPGSPGRARPGVVGDGGTGWDRRTSRVTPGNGTDTGDGPWERGSVGVPRGARPGRGAVGESLRGRKTGGDGV